MATSLIKISLDWPLALATQPCTSKLSDNPALDVCLVSRQFPFSRQFSFARSLCVALYMSVQETSFLASTTLELKMYCCYCISKVRLQTLKMMQW